MRWIVSCIVVSMLAISVVVLGQSTVGESPAVATVGSSKIHSEVFRTGYLEYLLKTGLHDSRVYRSVFLNRLIFRRLLVLEAEEKGSIDRGEFEEHRNTVRTKLMLDAYARRTIYPNVEVTNEDLEELFVRTNTQLTARHLFARTRPEAEGLLRRLDAGEDFEAVARETFRDTSLARTGGLVGPFTFDEMDPAFEDAAFGLQVGETSGPVRTDYGYSIIRLEDRFQKPILTETEFAQRKDKLERFVRHRKQQEARSEHVRKLRDEMRIRFVDASVEGLLAWITGRQLARDGEQLDTWLRKPLLSFEDEAGRRTWTLGEFRDRAQRTGEEHRAAVRTSEDLVDFASGLIVREVMIERAQSDELDSHPEFQYALEHEMETWVYEQAYERLASALADEPDVEVAIREHVRRLRADHGVEVHDHVLHNLPLIKPESS